MANLASLQPIAKKIVGLVDQIIAYIGNKPFNANCEFCSPTPAAVCLIHFW